MPHDKKKKTTSEKFNEEPKTHHQTDSVQEESKTFKKDEILRIYNKEKKRTLIIDSIALTSLCLGYSLYLIYSEGFLGKIFLIYAIISCIIIILGYTLDNKAERKGVEEDLEILFK